MKRLIVILVILFGVFDAEAVWYSPTSWFDDKPKPPRLSELLQPATRMIDEAAALAEDDKFDEALAGYQNALKELERIEVEHPDRAQLPEFATVRNKRAYVKTSINSLLLRQSQLNSTGVAVTDTTQLEERRKQELQREAEARKARFDASVQRSRRERMEDALTSYSKQDYAAAQAKLKEILERWPNDSAALNLRAMVEKDSGDAAAAERTMAQLIKSHPDVYLGYYNMAKLILETRGERGVEPARRFYLTGRDNLHGPADPMLEQLVK